ncbi:protein kinase [Psychrobacillus sp. FSL H8-0483]|uniref:serine/threonine protein kinase n=1 Tax=Psychrobacillus sp. FSL H8-0483 TaxID=2921389 RepID=UPI00315ADA2B
MRKVSILRSIRKIYQFFVDVPIKEGKVLNDRYEVLRVIGTGSYGIFYRCKDLKTNEIRGLKQLRPSKHHNKKEVALFENEIAVLRSTNHKNMPVLMDTFFNNAYLFYVMNFIEGDNLEDLIFLKRVSFNEKESLQLIADLLKLIDYLHSKDIYHGDLRIPNILLKDGQPFLIDFGLSKQGISMDSASSYEMKQQDHYDLGEILLYLLYTTYPSKNKKALPWTEELTIKKETVHLLKRLLQVKESYSTISEISADVQAALQADERLH